MEETKIEQPLDTKAADTSANKKENPVWLGIKLLFVDVGISGTIGFVMGFSMLVIGLGGEQVTIKPIFMGVGLLISMYATFLLYRQYSKDVKALIAIVLAGFLLWTLDTYVEISSGAYTLSLAVTMLAAQILAFVVGWYVAKTLNIRLFLIPNKGVTVFFVVGIILVFIALLAIVRVIIT